MKRISITAAVAAALCAFGGVAYAQEAETETRMEAEMDAQTQTGYGTETEAEAGAEIDAEADMQATTGMETDALQEVEPMVPVGPPMVPVKKVVKQVGPAVIPVAPAEKLQAVETVTLDTPSGPVVVISFPGTVPSSQFNIDFSALDSNEDGYISKAELDANAGRSAAALHLAMEFQRADTNADDRLGFTEIIGWVY